MLNTRVTPGYIPRYPQSIYPTKHTHEFLWSASDYYSVCPEPEAWMFSCFGAFDVDVDRFFTFLFVVAVYI